MNSMSSVIMRYVSILILLSTINICSASSAPSALPSSTISTNSTTSSSTTSATSITSIPVTTMKALMSDKCVSSVSDCRSVSNLTCLGRGMEQSFVSFHFTGIQYIWEAQSRLKEWTALRHVPECWTVLEPLLCAVYLPPCDPDQLIVHKVWSQICRVTQGPCRIAKEMLSDGWPDFLSCSNSSVFGSNCGDSSRKPSSRPRPAPALRPACLPPLIETRNKKAFFPGVTGCGLQCNFTGLAEESEQRLHSVLFVVLGAGAFAFGVATLTLCMARKWRRVLEDHIDFWITLIWTPVCLAPLLPRLFPSLELASVCEMDGTLVLPHSNSDRGLWCFVTFVVPYGGLVLINCWFLFWSYTTFHICHARDEKTRLNLNARAPTFMAFSLGMTFVLSLSPWWPLDLVSGDALTQLCALSSDPLVRILFVVLPLFIAHFLAGCFNVRTLIVLRKVFRGGTKSGLRPALHSLLFILAHHAAAIVVIVDELAWQFWGSSESSLVSSYVWCLIGQSGLADQERVLSQCKLPNHSITLVSIYTRILAWSMPALITLWPRCQKHSLHIWRHFFQRLCMPLPEMREKAPKSREKRYDLATLQKKLREARLQGRRSVSLPSISQTIDNNNENNNFGSNNDNFGMKSMRGSASEISTDLGNGRGAAVLETLSVAGFSRQGSFMSMMSMTPSERLEFHLFSQKCERRSKKHFFGMKRRRTRASVNSLSMNSFSDQHKNTLVAKTTRGVQTSPELLTKSTKRRAENKSIATQCELLGEPRLTEHSCGTALTTLSSSSSSTAPSRVLEPNVTCVNIDNNSDNSDAQIEPNTRVRRSGIVDMNTIY